MERKGLQEKKVNAVKDGFLILTAIIILFLKKVNFMSLVSVIMPYYSKRSYLENSLNSVLNQSYKNLEIILVNDEMDLETKKFLQTISKKI